MNQTNVSETNEDNAKKNKEKENWLPNSSTFNVTKLYHARINSRHHIGACFLIITSGYFVQLSRKSTKKDEVFSSRHAASKM